MDRVISARVDEEVVATIESLAQQLGISKKQIIERAVRRYAAELARAGEADVLERTCGAWKRRESPKQVSARARRVFQRSMKRHHS